MAETENIVQILLKVQADKAQLSALQADFLALKEQGTASMVGIGSSADDLLAHLQQIEQAAGLPNFQQGFSNATQAATAATQATEATSLSAANWSDRMLAANLAGEAWNAQSTTAVATQLGLGEATAKTAANFAVATPAMRAWSVSTNEQRAAMQALIETDNATGFERLVQGILAGTAATKNFNTETGLLRAAVRDAEVNLAQTARGFDQMTAGALRLVPGMGAASGAVRGLGGGAITTAAQIGVLNTVLAGTGIAGALAFTAALGAIVTKGIEVQKTLQDLGSGVQGTLKSNTDFGQNQISAAGPASIIAITNAARDAKVPISDLSKAFDQVFPSASRANTSIEGLATVLSKLISEEDNLHIPSAKIATDLQAIFNGSVTNTNQLAQQLSVTKEQSSAWREAGTTTTELIGKINEFAAASDTGTTSIARGQQMVSAAFEQLAAAAVKPIVQPLTNALIELSNYMGTVDASNVVSQIERIIEACMRGIKWAQDFGRAIVNAINQAANFVNSGVTALMNPTDNSALVDRLSGQEALQAKSRREAQDIELPAVTVEGTGTREPVGGAPKGRGGGGGGKGPSQDTKDQQEISDIMSQINEKQAAYNTKVEQAKVNLDLGKTSLSEENSLIVKAGEDYGKSIDTNIAKLTAEKQKIEEIGVAQGDVNPKEDAQINKLQTAIDKLTLMKTKLDLINAQNTFGGQWTTGLQKFGESLEFTGTKAVDTFKQITNQGIDATSQALTGLISGSKDWASAFQQAGQAIIQTLIKVALQAVIGNAIAKAAQKENIITQAYGAAAGTYKDVSQNMPYGWIYAPIFAAIAFAATAAFGAFAEGGIIGGSPSSKDNVLIHAATGEGVISTAAVSHYGTDMIHSMNAMTFIPTITPSFATGGIVGSGSFGSQGGGGTASKEVSVNNFWDKDEMVQHMIAHPDLNHHIINTIRKNRFQLKI